MTAPLEQPTHLSRRMEVDIWQVPVADFEAVIEPAGIEIYETGPALGIRGTWPRETELASLVGVVALRLLCSVDDVKENDIVDDAGPGPNGQMLSSVVQALGSGGVSLTSERLLGVLYHSNIDHPGYEVEIDGHGDGRAVAFSVPRDLLPHAQVSGGLFKPPMVSFGDPTAGEAVFVNLEELHVLDPAGGTHKAKKAELSALAQRFRSHRLIKESR